MSKLIERENNESKISDSIHWKISTENIIKDAELWELIDTLIVDDDNYDEIINQDKKQ